MGALALPGLEALVSCGRSSRYGLRRRTIMENHGRLLHGAVCDPALALVQEALDRLNGPPRSQYVLQPEGISRLAHGASATAAAKSALEDARRAARLSPELALAEVVSALALEDLGRSQEALRCLDRALRLEPREGWLYQLRADVRRRQANLQGFVLDCEQAILLDEGAAYFRFATGILDADLERLIAAAGQYLERNPRAHWMLATRADCRRSPEVNDFNGALADLRAAVKLKPDCSYAWAYLSRAQMSQGDGAAAVKSIARAIALAPACGWYRVWRGEVKRRLGRAQESLEDFDEGLTLDGDYEFGYAWRGGAERAVGRPLEALADLDLAADLDPAYAWTFAERSMVRRGLERWPEALEDLEKAVGLNAKHSWCPRLEDAPAALAELDACLSSDGRNALAAAWRGELQLRLGRPALAVSDLRRAVRLAPRHARAWAWLGAAQKASGRRSEALAALARALALDPSCVSALAERGLARLDWGPAAGARDDLRKACRLDPSASRLWEGLGRAEGRLKRWQAAADGFGQALELDGRNRGARLSRAAAFYRLNLVEEAEADLAVVLAEAQRCSREGRHRDAAQVCTEILASLPDCAAALRRRAEAWRGAGELGLAVEDHDALVRLLPGDETLLNRGAARRAALDFQGALSDARAGRGKTASSFMLESEALRNLGRFEGAEAAATRALSADPGLAWAWVVRAKARRQAGRLTPALEDAQRAVSLAPKDAKAHAWRGEILRKLGRRKEALRALERAVALDPSAAWARALRGEARRESGDREGCLEDIKEAVRIDGGCSCAYDMLGTSPVKVRRDRSWAWVYAWRGAIARRSQRWAEARTDLDRAVTMDPSCFWARAWRGELRSARGDLRGATADLGRAVSLCPEYADAQAWLGAALCRQGRCAAAQKAFGKALALEPAHVWALIGAGVCLQKNGRTDEGQARLERAKELAPGLFPA